MNLRKSILIAIATCLPISAGGDPSNASASPEAAPETPSKEILQTERVSNQVSPLAPAFRFFMEKQPRTKRFDAMIASAAKRHRLDPKLLRAVIEVESDFREDAVSPAGALGLMQLMPKTARDLGVRDPMNPSENIDGGARYLARLIRQFRDTRLALAAYNAGPGRVRRLGRIPENAETQQYVETVMLLWEQNWEQN